MRPRSGRWLDRCGWLGRCKQRTRVQALGRNLGLCVFWLARALPDLRDRLSPGGALAVIAYHSGEDRIVKHAMRDWSQACTCPPLLPRCECGGQAVGKVLSKRAVVPSPEECARNPRARSARLRGWRKAA